MSKSVKKTLAWLGIVIILGLFLYMSIQSYQLLTSENKTAEEPIATSSQSVEDASDSRVNWAEVVVLLIVGSGLIYAIRKIDRDAKKENAD